MFICVHLWFQALVVPMRGQAQAQLGTGSGLPETLEAIERARVVTRVLYVTAHPDDEPGPLLAWLARGAHADLALLSLTRGEGGQNALGPEQAPQLGLVRTEELLAACRFYGAKLYFGGAADFGFSKSPEEALKIWGEPALANLVRVIREFRPHIILNNWGGVRSGHGQHQAAGILTPQAMEAAADPTKFPDQLRGDVKPWKARTLAQFSRGSFPGATRDAAETDLLPIPSTSIAPLWGKSYNEIGAEGYSQHRSQGTAGAINSPFFRGTRSIVVVAGEKIRLAGFSRALKDAENSSEREAKVLAEADQHILSAKTAAAKLDWNEAASQLARAARLLRETSFEDSHGELLFDLKQAIGKIDAALALVAGVRIRAIADRGEITPGSNVTVRVEWQSRATNVAWSEPTLSPPEGWSILKQVREENRPLQFTVAVPASAQPDDAFHTGIPPWPAPLVQARVQGKVDGYDFIYATEVTAQRVTSTRVDTLPLVGVPTVTLTSEPRQFVLLTQQATRPLEVVVRVRYYGAAPAEMQVGVDSSVGWRVSAPVTMKFSTPGDQLVKFTVTPPARIGPGEYPFGAWARMGTALFNTSLEPLPTLPMRLWSEPALVQVHAFDARVPAGLHIGYVTAENDPLPDALRQIGVQVDLLDEAALAFGNLKKYDAIVVGIRAYELRQDLIRANARLLDYAAQGGTLLVQYQRENIWNTLKPAPYPANISSRPPANSNSGARPVIRPERVTDENSPVRFLNPAHAALNSPNRITQADFNGWVQERGLYFWTEFDRRYEPLLGLRDPGEEEATGGLLYARHGKGVYIYTGLAFFRQLPAGVPGAYRLLVNLLSQSKAHKSESRIQK